VVGAIVAGLAVLEFLAPDVWDRFCVQTLHVPRYWIEVLDYKDVYDPTTIIHHLSVAGRELVRPGSVFIDALQLGFYLLIPLGIAVEAILRQRTRAAYLLAGLYGVALLFANVRSAQIGALIIGILAVRPGPGRSPAVRVRFMLVLAAGAVLLLPAAASSGFTNRAAAVGQGQDTSTSLHWSSTREGIETLIEHPLGLGLGTQPGVGTRFQVQGTLTAENSYIGLGDELGVVTMVLFVAFVIVLIRRLGQARRTRPDSFVDAVRPTVIGVSVGAIFLHAWLYYSVGSTLLALAGVALGAAVTRGHDAVTPTDGR
jgi:hypothetical protein